MNSRSSAIGGKVLAFVSPFLVMLLAFTCLGLASGVGMAQDKAGKGEKAEKGEKAFEDFDRSKFERSTNIDNQWFPLKPGTQFVYEGSSLQNGKRVPHRTVFIVTDLTKVIDGVRAVVVWDRDFSRNELLESELTFFAQDNDGNVWHLGQLREAYEDGEFIGGQAWLVGDQIGSKAGIMMHADPRPGTPSYSEGYAPPPFNWTDRGRVAQIGQKTSVPSGTFKDVLVTEEFSQTEPDAFQLKYYARALGIVRVGWKGKDEEQETLELVKVIELSPEALADARAQALELETRAYIYGRTPPAEQMTVTAK
jgi:hypothetical protein